MEGKQLKPVNWIGSSKEDLAEFPSIPRREVGFALYLAQLGTKAGSTKPLKGFGGAGVLEIIADYDGNAYRGVYTVKFSKAIYVLHAFQKKSTKGIATSKADIELIRRRLKKAADEYKQSYGEQ